MWVGQQQQQQQQQQRSSSSSSSSSKIVLPGEPLHLGEGFLLGLNTHVEDGVARSSVCGVLQTTTARIVTAKASRWRFTRGSLEDSAAKRGAGAGNTPALVNSLLTSLCNISPFFRVNRLVYVKPLKSRYEANVGDVVVGRVADIANGKWLVDVGAARLAVLTLGGVSLDVQRRRDESDLLDMRVLFKPSDLLCCEVQKTLVNPKP
ncbi:exosome complex exonuclease, putative [Eimeria necatrix]|uniref:Exosome complex exonuclease, putative n=1 Tax=Eimeria necatrix TaxID=51315 RepID=U6N1S5_9EIME|nr:exosome complex exonuclease, putative [Eimeria necatrix]CDJ70433.1 exosome complex exonuclease, putative [Eimeria necatrix]